MLWFGESGGIYAFSVADVMLPNRDLLKPNSIWYWDETLDDVFAKSKQEIAKLVEHGVHSFELECPTCLATDWSKNGVGFLLFQKYCTCSMDNAPNCCKEGWRLIFAGS